MYESLLEWCKFPVSVYRCTGSTAGGTKTFAAATTEYCYRVDEMKEIQDKTGRTVVSNSQLYFPNTVDIAEDDAVALVGTEKREIRKVGAFNDGNTGLCSVKVVYL